MSEDLNQGYSSKGIHLKLNKKELDKACKDKHNKAFDPEFGVELFFEYPNESIDSSSGAKISLWNPQVSIISYSITHVPKTFAVSDF